MNIYVDYKNTVWLSYSYLKAYDISQNTIEQWSKRHIIERLTHNQRTFINYDTIPEPTHKKLLPKAAIIQEYAEQCADTLQNHFYNILNEAYRGKTVLKWRKNILDTVADSQRFSNERLLEISRKAAVFEKIHEIRSKQAAGLEPLYKAFLQLFPEAYANKQGFCRAIAKAGEDGILSIAIKRSYLYVPDEKYGNEHKRLAAYILSHSKAYNLSMSYEFFTEACKEENIDIPCFNWLRGFNRKHKNDIDRGRLGESKWQAKNGNYAKIIQAEYSGDQWQMDGWRIPIYCKKLNEKGNIVKFVTYNLFAVMDAHSHRIIGYDIAESENTESILKGLERAVKETGTLPFEIVADNHSFNKTKEAENLKEDFEGLGVHWTVDSNPRRKAILERAFKTLGDKHFKKCYGYIGQGVKTKEENGLTQPELIEKYTKTDNMLTFNQVAPIVKSVINEYNNTVIKKYGETPNNRYEKSDKPHAVKVDVFMRAKLFILKTEYKVRHGQVTIQRGQHKYEYQLPAEFSVKYNNKTVGVRHFDFNFDEIYLFESDTDEMICTVHQKHAIHGALANQTEEDIKNLQKYAGRDKGIKIQREKRNESYFKDNLDAFERVNKRMQPKDVIEEIRNNTELQYELIEEYGININNVSPLPKAKEMLDTSFNPKKENDKKHLWQGLGTMRKLTLDI